MPATDTSLTGRLMNVGFPAALAVDVAAAIVAQGAIAAISSGAINGATFGVSVPAVVKTSDLQAGVNTNISGTPGNGTSNGTRGRAAFAAAGSTVAVTSSLVTATSTVLVQLGGSDATLTSVRVTAGAGSFVVTGNAAATATTPFDFLVIN